MDDTKTLEIIPTDALERIERANTDMQIDTAKKYPRMMSVVKKEMLDLATLDQETAATCFYTLKRKESDGGEKIIQGPSARMAEIAVNAFGNIKAGARIIGNDGKMITAQAVCHDLEKNVCVSVEVRRRITNKQGKTYSEDMQVVTGNAACSIALRNAVFKVIPMALVKPVYDAAKKTAVGDAKTLAERRKSALAAFKDMGVAQDRVLRALNVKGVEDIGLAELEVLIGLHTAIKDNDTTIEEAFPTAESTAAKPQFGKAPSLFTAGAGKQEGQKPLPTTPAEDDNLVKLHAKMAESHIDELTLLTVLRANGVDESLSSLNDINTVSPETIADTVTNWSAIVNAAGNLQKAGNRKSR